MKTICSGLRKKVNEALIVQVCGVLGGDEGDSQEITLLNRIVRHGQTMNGWPFQNWEAELRHVEIIMEALGLGRAEGTKTPSLPEH